MIVVKLGVLQAPELHNDHGDERLVVLRCCGPPAKAAQQLSIERRSVFEVLRAAGEGCEAA